MGSKCNVRDTRWRSEANQASKKLIRLPYIINSLSLSLTTFSPTHPYLSSRPMSVILATASYDHTIKLWNYEKP